MTSFDDISVFATNDLQGFEDRLQTALGLLAQSTAACAFARTANEQGYSLYVDKTASGDLDALADHDQRVIFLKPLESAEAAALALGHEFCHVSQLHKGGLDTSLSRDTPATSLAKTIFMEADAFAHELLIAREIKSDALHSTLCARAGNPSLSLFAERTRGLADIPADRILAGGFKCFMADISLRRYYEDFLLRQIESLPPEKRLFDRQMAQDEIAARLDGHSHSYIQKHRGYIGLDHKLVSALAAPATAGRLKNLKSRPGL